MSARPALEHVRGSEEFRVNSARLADFAAALGETGGPMAEGRVAHPVFAHVPVMQGLVEVLERALPGARPIHGAQDFQFHRPIRPGMRLFSLSTLIGLRPSRAGAVLVVGARTETEAGDLVVTQTATCLTPGVEAPGPLGLARPRLPVPSGRGDAQVGMPDDPRPETVEIALPADQAARYAEAARDYSPYTLDRAAARAMGFEAPILHGMATLGLAAGAIVGRAAEGDPARLLRLGARFTAPVLMTGAQTLRLTLRRAGTRLGFELADASGRMVIGDGHAEVRP